MILIKLLITVSNFPEESILAIKFFLLVKGD